MLKHDVRDYNTIMYRAELQQYQMYYLQQVGCRLQNTSLRKSNAIIPTMHKLLVDSALHSSNHAGQFKK